MGAADALRPDKVKSANQLSLELEKLNYRAISATYLVGPLADRLKATGKFEPPAWATYAKTATYKQSLPQDPDWWYKRVASTLIKLSKDPMLGVNRLSKEYGGRRVGIAKPHHAAPSSRKIIRKIIDQLEEANLIKVEERKKLITPEGETILSDAGKEVLEKLKQLEPRLAVYNWAF